MGNSNDFQRKELVFPLISLSSFLSSGVKINLANKKSPFGKMFWGRLVEYIP